MASKRRERDIAYVARKKRRKEKKEKRKRIEREAEEKGLEPPPKQIPATLENTRVPDDTIVRMADKEVLEDEATDEFHEYFAKGKAPQIMITTRPRPSRFLFEFIKALTNLFPRAQFTPRGKQNIKELSASAAKQGFTHLIVLSEKNKICNGMMISHLRTGPTALFKVTTIKVASKLSKHGACIHSCTFERLGEGGFGGRGLLGTGRGHLTLLLMFLILVDSIDTSARRSTGEHAHIHTGCVDGLR